MEGVLEVDEAVSHRGHLVPSTTPSKERKKNMSEKELTQHNVSSKAGSVQSAEAFEALLEMYKRQNPEKYKKKVESGEFERQKRNLGLSSAPKEEKLPEPVSEEVAGGEKQPEGEVEAAPKKRSRKPKEQ